METNQLCQMGRTELNTNVMPFWLAYVERCVKDGKFEAIDFEGDTDSSLGISTILLCRILWSFSSYYRLNKDKKYLGIAKTIRKRLLDTCFNRNTGFYYEFPQLNEHEVITEYQTLTQAYAIYAFAEYAGATGKSKDYEQVLALISRLELAAKTHPYGVYADTITTSQTDKTRAQKSDVIDTRCQLHLIEAFVALLKVKSNDHVKTLLNELLITFELCVYAHANDYFPLTLNSFWRPNQTDISVGHNFEAAWLLYDAVCLTDNEELKKLLGSRMVSLVNETVALAQGPQGAFWTWQFENGTRDERLVWWVQAEAINAFIACFELTGETHFLDQLKQLWQVLQNQFRDLELGEWYTRLNANGSVDKTAEKVGPWRGPYHIVRACIRLSEFSYDINKNNKCPKKWEEGKVGKNEIPRKKTSQKVSVNI